LLVLDTHVLLWLRLEIGRMGRTSADRVREAQETGTLAVSAYSYLEVARLNRLGRLELTLSVRSWRDRCSEDGITEIEMDGAIAIKAGRLIDFHRDPADRVITATTLIYEAMLVTADREILAWSGPLDRLDARR
jgi:PIN domain nuclease of toxin-antitoxin system